MVRDAHSLNRVPLAILAGLALAMRLLALKLAWGTAASGDPENYLNLARSLLAGDGLALVFPGTAAAASTALFPPVPPLVLAAAGLVVPLNSLTLTLLNTSIDCAAALLLARLARLLGYDKAAIPAGLVYLAWPSIAFMAPLAYKEGLMIALLLASLVALVEQSRCGGIGWAALSGLAGGLMVLTQPALAPLLPILSLALISNFPTRREWFRASIVAAAAAVLVMLPWWVRNALLFDRFIPFTSSGGLSLWEGAQPSGGMVWRQPPAQWALAGEIEAGKLAAAEAWRIIAADPVGYVLRCLAKLPRSFFMSNWAIDQLRFAQGQRWPALASSAWLRIVPTIAELGVAILAAIGLVREWRSVAGKLLLGCLVQVYFFSMWFEFSERHRLFMTPFILLVAALLLANASPRGTKPAAST